MMPSKLSKNLGRGVGGGVLLLVAACCLGLPGPSDVGAQETKRDPAKEKQLVDAAQGAKAGQADPKDQETKGTRRGTRLIKPPKGAKSPVEERPTPVSQRRPRGGSGREDRTPSRAPSRTPPRNPRETPVPQGESEPVSSRLNVSAEDSGKPPEERTYRFSIVDGSYKDLVENFARMAGIGVLGEAPVGPVSFVTTEEMDFKTALNRVRLLLFKYKPIEPYWLLYEGKHFEVLRVTDVWRQIPLNQIFPSLEEFEASDIDDNELAMLRYTPADTSVADFTLLRDFMPDYVRIAPMAETNSLSIFALVGDIKKYLSLIKLFESAGDDPRVLAKLPVTNLLASAAVENLQRLMDDEFAEDGARSPRRRTGGEQQIDLPGQRTILFPDDAQGVIIIRAVPKKIDDVKQMLTFVDVPYPAADYEPVLIAIEHADVNEVLAIINPLVTGPGGTPAASTQRRRAVRRGKSATAAAIITEDVGISLIPDTRTNTLVVRAAEEDVERIRRYVKLVDVPLKDNRPVFVELKHVSAEKLAATITQIIVGSSGKGPRVEGAFTATAEPTLNALILTGTKKDIEKAQYLIERLDVGSDAPTLHTYRFRDASPTAVMDIITLLESQQGGEAAPTRGRGRRRVPQGGPTSHLYSDDATRTLYVVCSDDEWKSNYLPLLESLDAQAGQMPAHVTVPLTNLAPEEVIATLTQLFGTRGPKAGAPPKFAPAGGALLISGATASEIKQIEAIVAEIDRAGPGREQRLYPIKYVEPSDIKAVIDSGVVGPKVRPRRGPKAGAAVDENVIVSVFGSSLVVSGLTEDLDSIGDLIQRLDVPTPDDTEMRVYTVPPGHDVQNVVTLLESLLTTRSSRVGRAAKSGGAPTPAAMFDDVRIVAQPATRRVLISAPAEQFPEIEETIHTLLEGEPPERLVVKFIPVVHADAAAVAELVQPILQQRMNELVSTGELVGDVEDPKTRRAAMKPTGISVTPDVTGERVVVTAPPTIVAEAESLVAELDRPSSEESRVMRTITLSRTTPEEMVSTVSSMLSGERSAPKPKRPRLRGGRQPAGATPETPASATNEDVTIVAAPGGNAVVLRGTETAVEEVEGWIRHLDESAQSDTILKIYTIENAEIEQLADTIMDLCDTGAAAAPKRTGATESAFSFEPVGGVRKGGEITLTTDYWNKKILVRATPMKMFEIDRVVELFDGKEGESPVMDVAAPVPYLIYELENVDAFDAVLTLESVLEVVWTHGEPPSVDYISGTDNLVVKCLPEYNNEIIDLIHKYVDKDSGKKKNTAIVYETIQGANASEVAARLKLAMPDVVVNVKQLGEDLPTLEQLKPFRPCVLPASLVGAAQVAALTAPGQTEPSPTDEEREQAARAMADSFSGEGESAAGEVETPQQVQVLYDDRQGVIVIKGPPREVDEVRDTLDDIKKEIESISGKADIRIFRIRYRNVTVAANILEGMFNAARARQGARGATAQQQRLAQLQQRMLQMQQQMRGQQGVQPGQQPTGREGQQEEDKSEEDTKKRGVSEIRVMPDPQTRSLIVRAATEDFPIIIELLATIDRPAEVKDDIRIFELKNLIATEVEEQLKVLLGVAEASRQGARRPSAVRRGAQGGAQVQALQQIEEALLNLGGEGDEAIDAASDITITSYPPANTLLVKAPEPALDLIADLIEKLEAQQVPTVVTRTYDLKHASATEVVERINAIYGSARGRGAPNVRSPEGFDPTAVQQVTATADVRTNKVIISAFEPDFEKIEALITELDREMEGENAVQTYVLENADAAEVATTMNNVYGTGGRGGRGAAAAGTTAKFTGDPSSNTLFFTAPLNQREEILARIKALDGHAGELAKPKVIKLSEGKASEVARALQDSFAARGRRGTVKIVGDDVSNQLIITAPDELFTEIETLAKTMDQASLEILPRVFKLQHAKAVAVHGQLMDMVRQLSQQLRGKGMDVFTAVPDERSNTIVAVGGPRAFALVEQVISEVDVPESETAASRTRQIVALEHAEASDLARVINEDLRSAQPGPGRQPGEKVSVIANEALNSLLISGTTDEVAQVMELVKQMDLPAAAKERITKVYPVNYADPNSLVGTITGMFQQRRGTKPEEMVDVGYDWGTSKLVVTANEKNHEKVAAVLTKVDDAAANVRSERLIKLKHADAEELARKLSELFHQTVRGQRGQQAMTIAGDVGTNSLIVYANDAEFERVTELVTELDRKPEESRQRLIKSFKLSHGNPWFAKVSIMELFKTRGSRNPLDEVTAVEEWSTMSVIVAASKENMEKVEQFLADFDQPSASDSQVHVIELVHIDGAAAQRSLQEMFGSHGRGGQDPRGPAVQISNPQGTNTLLVKANDTDFAVIQAAVQSLDTATGDAGQIEVIALQNSDAEAMKEVLENYLAKPGQHGRGGAGLRGDVRISANPQNNTLVISASPEQVASLKETVAKLDVEVEGAGNAPRIIPIQHARASQIEPVLNQMFVEQRRSRGGGRGAETMVPAIAADEASNTLIVRASASDFGQIEALIEKLDTESGQETTFTIVPVAEGVKVADLATMVETTINEGERIKSERWGIDPGTIVVTADARTNSLIVAGTPTLFPDVERLVEKMEGMGPTGGTRMRTIRTKNISPDEVRRLLDQLIGENTSSSGSNRRASGTRGSTNRRQPSRQGSSSRRPSQRGGTTRKR